MGGKFSLELPHPTVAREVCVSNDSGLGFAFELRVPGCSTAFIASGQNKCVDLRNCQNPKEGQLVYPNFYVVTGNDLSPPITYSDYGPSIKLSCHGTTGDATCNGLVTTPQTVPSNDLCLSDKCYVVINQNRDRNSADTYCQSKGGRLASVTSQEENDFIQEIANRSYLNQNVFLGGVVEVTSAATTTLSWLDGSTSPTDYTNWASNEPSRSFFGDLDEGLPTGREDTVEMFPAGTWNDILSTRSPQPFVCQIPLNQVISNAPYN